MDFDSERPVLRSASPAEKKFFEILSTLRAETPYFIGLEGCGGLRKWARKLTNGLEKLTNPRISRRFVNLGATKPQPLSTKRNLYWTVRPAPANSLQASSAARILTISPDKVRTGMPRRSVATTRSCKGTHRVKVTHSISVIVDMRLRGHLPPQSFQRSLTQATKPGILTPNHNDR